MGRLDAIAELVRRRKLIDAEVALRTLLDSGEATEAVFMTHGRLLMMLGKHRLALAAFQKADEIATDPTLRLHLRQGRAALAACEWVAADRAFTAALKKAPDCLAAHYGMAVAAFWRRKDKAASQALDIVLQRLPAWMEAAAYKGFSLTYQGKFRDALPLLQEAVKRFPNWHEARVRLGDLLLRMHDYAGARHQFDIVLEAQPTHAWGRYFKALAVFQDTGSGLALDDMEAAAIALEAENPAAPLLPAGASGAWFRVGVLRVRAGELDEAAEALSHAVRLAPGRSHQRVQLGNVLVRIGRYTEALVAVEPVPRTSPDYRDAVIIQALCLVETGHVEVAVDRLEAVVDTLPPNAELYRELGRAYLHRGEPEQAELALAMAERLNPRCPGLDRLVIETEERLGRRLNRESGLREIPIQDIPIPEEFAPRVDDILAVRRPGLLDGLAKHVRIVHSLMRREMLTQYGRNQIGYVWALLQPALFVGTLLVLFSVRGRHLPNGVSLELFLVTGVVPVVTFFMQTQGQVAKSVKSARNLLYYREVTPYSLMISNLNLQFLTGLTVFMIFVLGLYAMGESIHVVNALKVLAALAGIAMLGFVIGGSIGLISLRFASAQFFSLPVNRFMFMLSGSFFYGNELPPQILQFFLFNPVFHLLELLREGFFLGYEAPYATWHYPLLFILCGMLLVLTLERVMRKYMALQ